MRRSLRSWLWQVPLDDEVDEELAFHLEMRTRELIERGVDPKVAGEMARARLGDVARVRDTCLTIARKREREMRVTQWLEERKVDAIFALRQLRGSPAFAAVAVLTLALGVGVNSAIFALADTSLLRPLPYPEPDRLMTLKERLRNGFLIGPAPLDFVDWAERNQTFEAVAAVLQGERSMADADGIPAAVPSQTVSVGFFDVMRIAPILGRTFQPGDEIRTNVVVLSEGFWRARFAADPALIGRSIRLDGEPFTVIGIVPAGFQMLLPATNGIITASPSSLWLPMMAVPRGNPVQRSAHFYQVIGRLKRGVSVEAARADMASVAAGIAHENPDTHAARGITIEPLRDALIGREIRQTSLLLLGVVGFVLLLCCANVANLLLARTAARQRELAVRSALGAGRRRIIAQLVTESLVLAALGGALGAVLGGAILRTAPSMVPVGLLPAHTVLSFDARVVSFCAVTTFLVGLVFGFAPAWRGTGRSLLRAIGSDARSAGAARGNVRGLIVAAEVAAAVLLLCGAGLLLRTFVNLAGVDPGVRVHDAVTMMVSLPQGTTASPSRYGAPDGMRRFYEAVQDEVARVSAVRSVGWGSALPFDGMWFGQTVQVVGDPEIPPSQRSAAAYQIVTPSYFATLGIPILHGRAFTDRDRESNPPVCIVDEAFVREYLGGRPALGMRVAVPLMSMRPSRPPEREIIGVIPHIKLSPSEQRAQAVVYVPMAQNPWWAASLVVRPTDGPPEALVPAIRAAVARVDRDVPLTRVRTLDEAGGQATQRWRFRAIMVGAFAVLALALAMVGVFGVLAYSVQQRTREFGVRIALGASVGDVVRLVCASAARTTAMGTAIGLAGAALLSQSIATLLFEVKPLDPITFVAAAAVLVLTAAIAAAAPALRAANVDPVVTFRTE